MYKSKCQVVTMVTDLTPVKLYSVEIGPILEILRFFEDVIAIITKKSDLIQCFTDLELVTF